MSPAPAGRTALVTGADGQLGLALRATTPPGWTMIGCGRAELDITDPDLVRSVTERNPPSVVIHAAAYTAVDAAEREPEAADAVNAGGTRHVALAARAVGARLIYLSTDYVFDGAQGRPYLPTDSPRPLNAYGRSKLAGERAALEVLGDAALVVRTAWVYSGRGRNFVRTMLDRMRAADELQVVADQVGTPTEARALARALWTMAERPTLGGIHHWTDAGVASWFDFAVEIREEALALGLLRRRVPIRPIPTSARPAPAARPAYSVLDKTATWHALGVEGEPWRLRLRATLKELTDA